MNKKHKLKTESLNKEITELKDKLKFKSNYIEELKAEIKEEIKEDITMGWNTGITTDMMEDYVNPEIDKLNDKIDINKNEKEHDELLKFIKGKITTVNRIVPASTEFSFYQLGEYSIKGNGVFYKNKPIFNKRIAKRLYNILDTMYKFKLEE